MDRRIKYCVELEKIKNLPESKRIRTETHFFLIREYLDVFLRDQEKVLGEKYGSYKTAEKYCQIKGISERTFYNWLRAYKENGIEGLVPQHGNKARSFSKSDGKRKTGKYTISISIDIVPDKSPASLEEIGKIIAASPLIAPKVKASFFKAYKRICDLASQKTALKVDPPLSQEEEHRLELYRARNHKKHSAKATAILMMHEGKTMLEIGMATNAPERTVYRWHSEFNLKRLESIETKPFSQARLDARELRRTRVVDILHKMPSLFGINRSSWTYGTISKAYEKEYGVRISETMIQNTIKGTGYSWRHARKVLTSPDPDYKAKVKRLLDTLQGLREGERFFFIDEVGPYRVRKYGGRHLALPGEPEIIPEVQRSRGKVQFVAALEALSNQLIWLFADSKGSETLVNLLKNIVSEYSASSKIYVTWDAIGVHSSKVLRAWISDHNKKGGTPKIEVVPLPSNSQFLNVIEAVFGGMKRAVICNSDYGSAQEMQDAIRRHFEERNAYFKENPKRAGDKIWDRERFDLDKLAGGLFKKM